MERVKKLSAIFLLLAVLSGACACGNKGKTPEPTVSAAPPAVKIDFALAKDNVTALTVALDDTAAPSSPPAGTEYADVADDGSPIDGPADGSVPLMGNLEPMGADRLAASYGVDTSCFDEFDFEFAFASIKSNMYLIVKPKPGAKAGAQAELDLFFAQYAQQWRAVSDAQARLVDGHLQKTVGDYIVAVVSTDNARVFAAIEAASSPA